MDITEKKKPNRIIISYISFKYILNNMFENVLNNFAPIDIINITIDA